MTSVPTWLAALAIAVPALTALGGYWLAGRNEEGRDLRTAERERRQRRDLLAEKLDERRHDFQLDLLLNLQDAVRLFARATYKVVRYDQDALRVTGTFTLLGPDLDKEIYDAGVDLGRLRFRVLDGELRDQLDALHSGGTRLELSHLDLKGRSPEEAIAILEERALSQGEQTNRVNERIGALIRAELKRSPESVTS